MSKYTSEYKERTNPRQNANFLSNLFLLDVIPLYKKGAKNKKITENDLYDPLDEHKAEILGNHLEHAWIRNKQSVTMHSKIIHLSILQVFGKSLLMIGLLALVRELALITILPYLVDKLIVYFSKASSDVSIWHARLYGFFFFMGLFIERCMANPTLIWMTHTAMKIRLACSSLLFRKAMKLNNEGALNSGKLVNLLSNDVGKFDMAITIHYTYIGPLQSAIAAYLLYEDIGYLAFFGLLFMILFIPIQMYFAKLNASLRSKTASETDKRIKLMQEIVESIRVIKMYVWERFFNEQIQKIRNAEIKFLRRQKCVLAITYSFFVYVSRIATFITLLSYFYKYGTLDAAKAFKIITLFTILRKQLMFLFPSGINALGQVLVSLNRMQDFLNSPERTTNFVRERSITPSIKFCKVSIGHNYKSLFTDIDLYLKNELVCLNGPVGCGKTSLLAAILEELPARTGKLQVQGSISYCPQEIWLFSGTVRDNVIFGSKYEENKLKRVFDACGLTEDVEEMPRGDLTNIGDNGALLSGGQKARINLARCIYRDADIYLLDDPLSSVDIKVAKEIFDKCIKKFLCGKLVVMVTQQSNFFKEFDKVVLISSEGLITVGSYHELIANGCLEVNKNYFDLDTKTGTTSKEKINTKKIVESGDTEVVEIVKKKKISWNTYKQFFKFGGSSFLILSMVAFCVLAQFFANTFDYYIAYWVDKEKDIASSKLSHEEQHSTRTFLVKSFSAILTATITFSLVNCFAIFLFMNFVGKNIHQAIINTVMEAKMTLFDATTSGKIINIFLSDTGIVDEYLPKMYMDILQIIFSLIGTVVITSLVNWYLLIPYFFIVYVLQKFRLLYLTSSTSLKRIETARKSPIYGHAASAVQGLHVIRAFDAERYAIDRFDFNLDNHSSAWFTFKISSFAFGFWIDLLAVIFIGLNILLILVYDKSQYGGNLGLVITQYLLLMGNLQSLMKQWTELENSMVSVERILEYTNLKRDGVRPEGIYDEIPTKFPKSGKIVFQNLSLSYPSVKGNILKNINCSIEAGEKIGIVGRTGAGKSSLIAALFQMYDINTGAIIIDDLDLAKLPVQYIRTKLAIIPQEATIFSGTIRSNLDPYGQYTDETIWKSLECAEIKTEIKQLPMGLNAKIEYKANNFSIGQKQLLCLARALLRKSKILVLDEPTSSVDPKHEQILKNALKDRFQKCTVLTVAHKLNTIEDSDKILVMDQGCIVEFDKPDELLKNPFGLYYKMVHNN